jgi:DNA-binding PadR family transcriptional regulator
VNAAKQVILSLLAEHPQGLYGLDIVRLSQGRLTRGMVYVHLGALEEDGLVETKLIESEHPGALPRPRYFITERGRHVPVDDADPEAAFA